MGMVIVLLLGTALAQESGWLRPDGAGEFTWGTSAQPMGALQASRAFDLPDSGFIGRNPSDRPDDLELPGPFPDGERRFLRYVAGQLTDAWVLREGPIHLTPFEIAGDEDWSGPVLGPGADGWRHIGNARSWTLNGRTMLHWADRMSDQEVLASRAPPTGTYAVVRASKLVPGGGGRSSARIRGELKNTLKPAADYLSGCLERAPKPVEARLEVDYDPRGQPGRVRATSDQPTPKLVDCMAAAVIRTGADPGTKGEITLYRSR